MFLASATAVHQYLKTYWLFQFIAPNNSNTVSQNSIIMSLIVLCHFCLPVFVIICFLLLFKQHGQKVFGKKWCILFHTNRSHFIIEVSHGWNSQNNLKQKWINADYSLIFILLLYFFLIYWTLGFELSFTKTTVMK